jgi:hypothetical protein
VVCLATIASASWFRFNYFADDSFISLRYVRHLAHGEGYVYNLGERVEGATNLLWILLLVPCEWLRLDLVWAARVLGLLCAAGALTLAAIEVWKRSDLVFGIAVVAFGALQADFCCWSAAGLETPLVALLGMLILQRAGGGWGPFAGLAFAARPDGLLSVLGGGRGRRADYAWLAGVVGAITAFRLAYFHALVPNSASAKLSASTEQWAEGARYLATFLVDGNELLVLCALIGIWACRSDPLVRGAAFWIAAQVGFCVLVGGDGLSMHRFLAPIVPPLALLAALGLEKLVAMSGYRLAAIPWALCVAIPLGMANGGQRSPLAQRDAEIPRWSEAGRWLASHSRPEDVVAAAPIGAVGYYSERPILDLLGLTDPHIARVAPDPLIRRPGHQRHDGPYVLDQRPAFILLGNIDLSGLAQTPRPYAWEHDLDEDPRLRRDYQVCSPRMASGMVFNFWYRRDRGACP